MDSSPTHDLRLPEEKSEVANRKDPLEFATFMAKWTKLIERKGLAWQAGWAIAELEEREVFRFVCPAAGQSLNWRVHDLFGTILKEMRAYRAEACGRLAKEYYRDAKEVLQMQIEKVQKAKKGSHFPDITALLEAVEKTLSRSVQRIDELRARRQKWTRAAWEHLWHDVPRTNLVEGKPELDTRLQVQVGKILGDYLLPEKVRVESIARLIVLAYCAGDLAEWDGEVLRTTYTRRILRVRNVRDILRKRGLVKGYSSRNS